MFKMIRSIAMTSAVAVMATSAVAQDIVFSGVPQHLTIINWALFGLASLGKPGFR